MSSMACIKEALYNPTNNVQYTICLLKIDCNPLQWLIARLLAKLVQKCHAQQAQTNNKCNSKVGEGPRDGLAATYFSKQTYFHMKKLVQSKMKNRVQSKLVLSKLWFYCDDIQCFVKRSKKPQIVDQPQLPRILLVKIGANLTQSEISILEIAKFQMQQQNNLSLQHQFQSSSNIPLPQSHFKVLVGPHSFVIPKQFYNFTIQRLQRMTIEKIEIASPSWTFNLSKV